MSPRIYVESLRRSADDTWYRLPCAPQRTVTSTCVIRVKTSGQPFGYQFVEIGLVEKAEEIMMALNVIRLEGLRLDLCSVQ